MKIKNRFSVELNPAIKSININGSLRDPAAAKAKPNSRHNDGRAIDIDRINGIPVNKAGTNKELMGMIKTIQDIASEHKNIEQNFGWSRLEEVKKDGNIKFYQRGTAIDEQHKSHIHIGGKFE